jgi:hypothetical protein
MAGREIAADTIAHSSAGGPDHEQCNRSEVKDDRKHQSKVQNKNPDHQTDIYQANAICRHAQTTALDPWGAPLPDRPIQVTLDCIC